MACFIISVTFTEVLLCFPGVLSADHMVKFLEDLMYPLTPFHHKAEILDFTARHDVSLLWSR